MPSTASNARLAELLAIEHVNPLGPGAIEPMLRANWSKVNEVELLAPAIVQNPSAAKACLAGVWLRLNDLDASHAISQGLASAEGSFWHAIMHRREPDPANSKYWWRRVGAHPVLSALAEQAAALGYAYTDPFAFVDFVEQVRGTGSAAERLAERVQLLEWRLLFDRCHQLAVGG